jgi:hypothetical protein
VVMMMAGGDMVEDQVTIPKKYYDDLREAYFWLQALESAGVDNWDGISFAQELLGDNNQ